VANSEGIFAGLAGIELGPPNFDLGSGVRISKTYAHLMAPFMLAYSPAPPGQHHPAPWSAAAGGLAFDMHVQIEVPSAVQSEYTLEPEFIAWWITAMLRLRVGPAFIAPVLGEQSFETAKLNHSSAKYIPLETESRLLVIDPHPRKVITELDLAWTSKYWVPASRLFNQNEAFRLLFEAVDQSMFARRRGLALLWLWGGLEAIFSPDKAELKYRISSVLASFLEPAGTPRLTAQKAIAKLYDSRSAAAHGRSDKKHDALQETYDVARRSIIRMIETGRVPTHAELEAKLFGADPL
jgi:hypothetical protein